MQVLGNVAFHASLLLVSQFPPCGTLLSWWAMLSKSSFPSSVEGHNKETPQRRTVYARWSWKANSLLPRASALYRYAKVFTSCVYFHLLRVSLPGSGNLMLFSSWYHPWFYFSRFSLHPWVALSIRSGIHFYKVNPLWCLAHGLHNTPNKIILFTYSYLLSYHLH